MGTRAQARADALASVRVEGLDPGVAAPLLDRWVDGELTDQQLDQAARRLAAGEAVADLVKPAPVRV